VARGMAQPLPRSFTDGARGRVHRERLGAQGWKMSCFVFEQEAAARQCERAKAQVSDSLRKENQQFELGFGNISGDESGEAAALGNCFPRYARLIQAEVLIVEFDWE
jgi:hypothetical protein